MSKLVTVVSTMVFAIASTTFTCVATGSWSAGMAVLFGLWTIAGIIEMNRN